MFVRVRPMNREEKAVHEDNIVNIAEDHKRVVVADGKKDANYSFDHVFSPQANHQDVRTIPS